MASRRVFTQIAPNTRYSKNGLVTKAQTLFMDKFYNKLDKNSKKTATAFKIFWLLNRVKSTN